MFEELKKIIGIVEKETAYVFDKADVEDTFFTTLRKVKEKNKPGDYFPILFRNELEDLVSRTQINLMYETRGA